MKGNYKRMNRCFSKDPVPNTYKYFENKFNVLG